MKRACFLVAILCCGLVLAQTIQSNSIARNVLSQSALIMGGAAAADTVADGTVEIVAGSRTDTGTIRVLTRGFGQSRELVNISGSVAEMIYSGGAAQRRTSANSEAVSLELAASSQSPVFPLPILASYLNSQQSVLEYVGQEALGDFQVQHVRAWRSYQAVPKLQHLTELSRKDFWIDSSTGVVRKIAYVQRQAAGASPPVQIEVFFADYRNVSGIVYPFLMLKTVNGTVFETIRIQTVVVNTGLSDADFPID